MSSKFDKFLHHPRFELITVILLIFFAVLIRGWNMFNLPYYENDEGVYMSQAWSLLTEGKLAPYTYWYDHAPGGWLLIALWTVITGGFETFGFYIHSGRVLVFVLHALTCWMLYHITQHITQTKRTAFAAVLIYACSPLGNYFSRRILLDPLMIFWVITTFYLIIFHYKRLSILLLSSVTFAIAVLTKENAIFFLPVFLFMVFKEAHRTQRLFAVVIWFTITGAIISTYPLYALLKGELFPANSFLGSGKENVSLIEAWTFQLGREGATSHEGSLLQKYLLTWIKDDAIIVIGGIIATVINVLYGLANRKIMYIALLSVAMIFFLLRGGVILEFYIIPLIPLFAWNIALAMHQTMRTYVPSMSIPITLGICTILILQGTTFRNGLNLYTSNQTKVQREAVAWIKENQTPNTTFIIDNYAFYPLNKDKPFNEWSHWYWKLDQDRDVYSEIFNNDLSKITYLTVTPQVEFDAYGGNLVKTKTLIENSKPIINFWENGWGVNIRGTLYEKQILVRTYESYKRKFIQNGMVIDPQKNNLVTSEGQSYALLRAVYMRDKKTFDEVLNWTNTYLRREDNLYAWRYENNTITDNNSASDASIDIATALLFAAQTWQEEAYLNEAKILLSAMWQNEVAEFNNTYFFTAGNWANSAEEITINPSYFSPYSFKLFAQIDPEHNWDRLVDTSYGLLEACTTAPLDKQTNGVLPPEWCALEKATGNIQSSRATPSTDYSFNAIRIPLRVYTDYHFTKDPRALNYLQRTDFLNQKLRSEGKLLAAYTHDGNDLENYETVVMYASALPHLLISDTAQAQALYQNHIQSKLYENATSSYWEDPENYYTQNLAWFTTLLYMEAIR